MPWFKVDDNLAFHRKTVAAGNAAMGLWVRAGSWAAAHLSDGFVPDHMIAILGSPAQKKKLVAAGLWIPVDGGCQFHGWNEKGRQPTAKSVLEERERTAARQAKHRNGTFEGTSPATSPAEKNNLASTSTKKNERTACDEVQGRFADFPENAQVNGTRNGVTGPLVTGVVTGVVTPPPTRPDPYLQEEEQTLAPLAVREPSIEDLFAEFWAAYPRRQDKRAGEKAWRAAVKRGVDPARITEAAVAYARQQTGRERRYIKLPASWLNAGAYDNDPEPDLWAAPRPAADDKIAGWQSLKTGTDGRALYAITGGDPT